MLKESGYALGMPRKGEFGKKGRNGPQRTQAEVDKFIKRFHAGESVAALVKEYKVSRAQAYNWITRHKEQHKGVALTPADLEKSEKITLRARVAQLEDENKRLLNKVMAMMIKYKEI
jgi:transposase-like protein